MAHQLGRTRMVSHEERQRGETFAADHTHFEALAVRLRTANGNHVGIYEMSECDGLSRIVNDLTRTQPDELRLGDHSVTVVSRETQEDFIVNWQEPRGSQPLNRPASCLIADGRIDKMQ